MGLFDARIKRRLTQWDLRIKTGIHQSKISLIENSYITPTDDEKKKIARALRFPVSVIFGDNGDALNDERTDKSA